MSAVRLTVVVDERDLPFLEVLAGGSPGKDAAGVLGHLARSAADGVRRPGAWERSWVEQAFGDEFHERIEQDPAVRYYVRPKVRSSEIVP